MSIIFKNKYIGNAKLKRMTTPVVGYKRANLMLGDGGMDLASPFITPIHIPDEFKAVSFSADSECPIFANLHAGKPHALCACGFYSYTDIDDAIKHNENFVSPLLKTVSSGKMVMYAKGVRAGHQRVEEVSFQMCYYASCINPADRIVLKKFSIDGLDILGICGDHYQPNTRTFTWLEEKINNTFRNGEPGVKVRQLDESVVPWYGKTPERASYDDLIMPVSKFMKENAFLLACLGTGFGGFAYLAITEFIKIF